MTVKPTKTAHLGYRMKAPFTKNPELSKVPHLQPEVGRNIALHTSPTARNCAFSNLYSPGSFNFIFSNPPETQGDVCHNR